MFGVVCVRAGDALEIYHLRICCFDTMLYAILSERAWRAVRAHAQSKTRYTKLPLAVLPTHIAKRCKSSDKYAISMYLYILLYQLYVCVHGQAKSEFVVQFDQSYQNMPYARLICYARPD